MSKKFLLISQVFYPDEVAVANLLTNLCVKLHDDYQFDIEVWTSQPSYTCLKKQPRSRDYKGIRIKYLKSTNYHKDKFLGRLINYITFTLSLSFKLLFNKDKSKIVSHTTPPFLAIIIAFIARLKRREFIYLLFDIYPDGLVRLNMASKRNPLIQIWARLHLAAMKRTNKMVVIGRDMKEWLLSIYPEAELKTYYIPIWQDDRLIKPIPYNSNPFVVDNNLMERFVVQYSGNMGIWNEMLTFGEAVKRNPEDVLFMFIGGGMRKKSLLEAIGTEKPLNVLFYSFLPNEVYSNAVSACHIALVSLRNNAQGMAVPSKIMGILASGIPVIAVAPKDSEIAYIIGEEQCGYVVAPGDVDGLINAILKIKNDESLRIQMGKHARSAFEKKYTLMIVAENYANILC